MKFQTDYFVKIIIYYFIDLLLLHAYMSSKYFFRPHKKGNFISKKEHPPIIGAYPAKMVCPHPICIRFMMI